MTTITPMIVKCPYCGKKSSYMGISSCYYSDFTLGTDGQIIGNNPSSFLCKRCKNIYLDWIVIELSFFQKFLLRLPSKKEDSGTSYGEIKLHKDSLYKIKDKDSNKAFELGLYFLHRYNNQFYYLSDEKYRKAICRDEEKNIETEEDKEFKKEILEYILEVIPNDKIILKGEIFRELGMFDKCIKLLENYNDLNNDEDKIQLYAKNQILGYAKKGDSKAYIIIYE